MKKKGWSAILRRKQYLIAGALVIIAAIGTTALYSSRQEKEREQMEAELAQEMQKNDEIPKVAADLEDTEQAAEASAVIPPESTEKTEATETAELAEETETPDQPAADETASNTQALHFAPEDGMLWPMEGNVILNYSMDATVYFATLDQYKYNPAVMIAGDVNSKVYSVAKGQVESIKNDEVTGCTMTVDLGDGYQAVYGQLKELNFAEGDYVEAGHVLGYISEPTKYFSIEGSNLYFELLKNGNPVDPVEFFE